jgi:hypothetical protein
VGSAGSRYNGSGPIRGVSPKVAGSASSIRGVSPRGAGSLCSSGVNPGGGAKGSPLIVGTPGVIGTEESLVLGPSETVGSVAGILVPLEEGVLTSSSEEELEPWIVARGVPGAMTVGTGSSVGTVAFVVVDSLVSPPSEW